MVGMPAGVSIIGAGADGITGVTIGDGIVVLAGTTGAGMVAGALIIGAGTAVFMAAGHSIMAGALITVG